jgi:hypothetical protein
LLDALLAAMLTALLAAGCMVHAACCMLLAALHCTAPKQNFAN